jgi:type IV secretion system protein VirB4
MAGQEPEGWWVSVRQSLTQVPWLAKLPLQVAGVLWLTACLMGVLYESWVPLVIAMCLHLTLMAGYAYDPQFLDVWTEHFELDGGEERADQAAERLPWAFLVGPVEGTVLNKAGAIQRTWAFRPPDMESTTKQERLALAAQLNNALKRLGSGWCVHVEATRVPTEEYVGAEWPNAVTALIDAEREALFGGSREHFATKHFLTLTYQPSAHEGSRQKLVGLLVDEEEVEQSVERQLAKTLETFERQAEPVVRLLERQFPYWKVLDDRQTLTYLHSTVSGKATPVNAEVPEQYIDVLVGDTPLDAGLDLKVGEEFVETVCLRGFPAMMCPGILQALDELAMPYRWTQRYICMGSDEAKSELDKYRKSWSQLARGIDGIRAAATGAESSMQDRGALDRQDDAEEAMRELSNGYVAFGFYTGCVVVRGSTKAEAKERAERVESVIHERGFTTIRESGGVLGAWLGSLPGNATENVRRPLLHSLNVAHLLPLSGTWPGEATNTHFGGPPHMQTATRGSTPFRLSLNVGDVGHTMVLGKTGSGKSTLLAFMAAQWLRYPNAQVFFFDKGKSARALTMGVGGAYYEPAGERGMAFQPLRNVDQKAEREWAAEWVEELLILQGAEMTATRRQLLWEALERLAAQPPERRTMSFLARLTRQQELTQYLRPYTQGGQYGDLLDAAGDEMELTRWVCFEMESLMARKDIVAPVLDYLFHRLEARFDGSPTLLVLDEAWVFLDHPRFRARIREWLKVLRKKNVYVVFASQEIADALDSEIASSLISACPSKILLPHPEANTQAMRGYYQRLGLNDAQIQMLSRAELKRQYYYTSSKGKRLFELGLEHCPATLRFVGASDPAAQKHMDQVLERVGKQGFAPTWLEEAGLEAEGRWVRQRTRQEERDVGDQKGKEEAPPANVVPIQEDDGGDTIVDPEARRRAAERARSGSRGERKERRIRRRKGGQA